MDSKDKEIAELVKRITALNGEVNMFAKVVSNHRRLLCRHFYLSNFAPSEQFSEYLTGIDLFSATVAAFQTVSEDFLMLVSIQPERISPRIEEH